MDENEWEGRLDFKIVFPWSKLVLPGRIHPLPIIAMDTWSSQIYLDAVQALRIFYTGVILMC